MEKEERVIVDYDKYQELLAKANLNEKYIEDIKSELSKKHEIEIRDLERQVHQAFKEGLDAGISMSYSDAARTIRKDLLGILYLKMFLLCLFGVTLLVKQIAFSVQEYERGLMRL